MHFLLKLVSMVNIPGNYILFSSTLQIEPVALSLVLFLCKVPLTTSSDTFDASGYTYINMYLLLQYIVMFSNKCYYDQKFSPLNLSVKYHIEFHKWLKPPFTNNYIGNICICSGDTWVCFMCKIWEWKDGWCDTFNLIIIRITTSLYNSYINITGESIYSRDHQYNVHCSSIRQYTYIVHVVWL